MKIAIVGFGISGSALLMALKKAGKLDTNIEVDVFDPNDERAVGLAYGEDDEHLLVNAFPTAMSLNPENKFEFSEWLAEHYPEYDAKVDLVPRPIYGEYAKERLVPLLEEDNITYYKKEIIDTQVIEENFSPMYQLEDSDQTQYGTYNYLFLALGTPPYQDFYNLRGVENYVHNPYPVVEKLKDIEEDKKVAIIGSGLTAFDLVNYLSHEKELTKQIGVFTNVSYFNSLRVDPYQGPELEYSLDKDWIEKEFYKSKGIIPLDSMIETIKRDLKANDIDLPEIRETYDPQDLDGTYKTYFDQEHPELSKLQGYIARLSGYLGDLYMTLSKADKARYHKVYAPLFSHYQVRLAPDAVANMHELKTNGKLFIVPDLIEIEKDDTFTLTGASGDSYQADVVLNATGFNYNTHEIGEDNPYLAKLLDKGLLLDKDNRGLLVTWPETQVISQLYGKLESLFYIGPWLSNTHYGNNNVKSIVQKADEIVKNYIKF